MTDYDEAKQVKRNPLTSAAALNLMNAMPAPNAR
jgi:hypothetical protein